ncbi:hypothetical protein BDY24DRAFT_276346 [Mrakia frigida]|uniref:uncharacterized protein n=1 Tax=Mrakia frigida TaxID=29902 RepID=UPI003FCC02DD
MDFSVASTSSAEASYQGVLPSQAPSSAQAQPPSSSLPSFPSPPSFDSDRVASSSTLSNTLELKEDPPEVKLDPTEVVKVVGKQELEERLKVGGKDEGDGSFHLALPTSGRWLEIEQDALARFLSRIDDCSAIDEDGRDAFDGFATTNHTRRTARACRMHHRSSKPAFDALIERLRAGLPLRGSPVKEIVEKKPKDRKGKGREVEINRPLVNDIVEDNGSESFNETEEVDYTLGIRPNSYDAVEEADFRRMLRTSDTVVEASKRFHLLHPHRSYESIRRRHNRLSANYEGILTRKLDGETFVRGGAPFWTTEEQDELAQLLAVSQDDGIAVHRVFQISHPRRTTAGIRGQYDRHRKKYDQRIQAIKDGDLSKPSPFVRKTAKPKSRLSVSPSPSPSPPPSSTPFRQARPRPPPRNPSYSPPPSVSFTSMLSIPRLHASPAPKRTSEQGASSSSSSRKKIKA